MTLVHVWATLVSSLNPSGRTHACDNETLTFTCEGTGTELTFVIGSMPPIRFDDNMASLPIIKFQNDATAFMTIRTPQGNMFEYRACLTIVGTTSFNVTCEITAATPDINMVLIMISGQATGYLLAQKVML